MKIELDTIESRIDKRLESIAEPPRPHFGVSGIGESCERKAWLRHRWAVIESFSGRMLRLFNRGHNEEPVMAEYLRGIGIDLRKTGFDQVKVDFGSHVRGSIDGIIISGVPEAPKKLHTWECKTASDKSFNEIKKNGVEKAKPEHWAQIQGYLLGTFSGEFKRMYGFGDIDRCLWPRLVLGLRPLGKNEFSDLNRVVSHGPNGEWNDKDDTRRLYGVHAVAT